ncbi:shieldin complex subunit 1 isoform X3 [Rhinatrema bivittatum]|uniref:shieldin complex subunit 1 isoform X3 n=1 Tax=Rhinatrema bivittatum TaxID=194408 RepID=UPI00112EC157|nr:shieldin complex subunit 1 isoform X3 [Rhinatrema bivittatum]
MLADWPLFFLPSLLFLSKHGVPVSLGFRIMGENEPTQGQMSEEYSSFVDFPSSYDLMSILQNQGYNSGLNDSSPAPWCTLVSSGSLTAGSDAVYSLEFLLERRKPGVTNAKEKEVFKTFWWLKLEWSLLNWLDEVLDRE